MNPLELVWRNFVDSPRSKLVKGLLFPFSSILAFISSVRNWAYDQKVLKSSKPFGITVISIGNLTVGGTGKTPLTILIAKELEKKGKGAILTRGYRKKSDLSCHIHQDNLHEYHPDQTGDEPYLMAKSTSATVIVDKNRELGLQEAHSLGCRWVLLDDGFQRRQTERDLDIVVVGPKMFGNGLCFPAGPLREPVSNIKRAHLICLIAQNSEECEKHKQLIHRFAMAPIIEARWHPIALISHKETLPIKDNDQVGLFSGIGNPSLFIDTAKARGLNIKRTLLCGDHKVPSLKKISTFWSLCQKEGCQKLICTEKDYIKLAPSIKEAFPIYYMKSELRISSGEALFKNILDSFFT